MAESQFSSLTVPDVKALIERLGDRAAAIEMNRGMAGNIMLIPFCHTSTEIDC